MTIVEELRNDRESGARRLESEYKAGLMILARRLYDDPSDAEELVNRTFAAVVEGIDGFLEQSSLFTWMCRILNHIYSMDCRRKSHQMVICQGELPDIEDDGALEEVYRNLDASLVRDAIGLLPPDQRETLLLHYFMDIPVAKMAKILAVPVGTVHSRLHYARKALAAKLGVRAHEMARKPGAKALLVALALAAITAAGAATSLAVVRLLSQPQGARGQQAYDSKDITPPSLAARGSTPTAAQDKTGGTEGTGETGEASAASVPSVSPVLPSIASLSPPLQSPQETIMNTPLRPIAASAAIAAATVAPCTTSASPESSGGGSITAASNAFTLDTRPSPQTQAATIETFSTQPSAFVIFVR